jgi:hypothetical protein
MSIRMKSTIHSVSFSGPAPNAPSEPPPPSGSNPNADQADGSSDEDDDDDDDEEEETWSDWNEDGESEAKKCKSLFDDTVLGSKEECVRYDRDKWGVDLGELVKALGTCSFYLVCFVRFVLWCGSSLREGAVHHDGDLLFAFVSILFVVYDIMC